MHVYTLLCTKTRYRERYKRITHLSLFTNGRHVEQHEIVKRMRLLNKIFTSTKYSRTQ